MRIFFSKVPFDSPAYETKRACSKATEDSPKSIVTSFGATDLIASVRSITARVGHIVRRSSVAPDLIDTVFRFEVELCAEFFIFDVASHVVFARARIGVTLLSDILRVVSVALILVVTRSTALVRNFNHIVGHVGCVTGTLKRSDWWRVFNCIWIFDWRVF